ncbi:MAG: MBL fold metallo-hydrolase [Lachnospiraceae bacterium]|nr:MBL fold metallo-hydrolase [Lachnospiraceae bacterium]
MASKKTRARPSDGRSRRFQQKQTEMKWRLFFSLLVMGAVIGVMVFLRARMQTPTLADVQITKEPSAPPAMADEAYIEQSLEIRFLDVGEGDAALVSCEGHHMLIDGGRPESSDMIYTVLKDLGITHLDSIVCTHPHEDHAGGLAAALRAATAGTAYAPEAGYSGRSYENFTDALKEQSVPLTAPSPGDRFFLGSAEVTFLAPVDLSLAEEIENNASIILRIVYGNTSFLFTGDAESAEELSLLDTKTDIRSTVLKAGHHGSFSSSTDVFLDAVKPEYCVISCAADNPYEHPHEVMLRRLSNRNITVYRTDLQGDIICRSDGETVTFSTQR